MMVLRCKRVGFLWDILEINIFKHGDVARPTGRGLRGVNSE